MKWYEIIAIVFAIAVLAGIVYVGANTDIFFFEYPKEPLIDSWEAGPEIDFEINYENLALNVSKTPPTSENFEPIDIKETISDSWTAHYTGELLAELEKDLINAKSEEVRQILEDKIKPILQSEELQSECRNLLINLEYERAKMGEWTGLENDPYTYPNEGWQKMRDLGESIEVCIMAHNEGLIDLRK